MTKISATFAGCPRTKMVQALRLRIAKLQKLAYRQVIGKRSEREIESWTLDLEDLLLARGLRGDEAPIDEGSGTGAGTGSIPLRPRLRRRSKIVVSGLRTREAR